ncbi:peptidase inhibitor family I36 protein [Streptomyces sp. NPDC003635]
MTNMKKRPRPIRTLLASVALATAALATAGPTHAQSPVAHSQAGPVTGIANAAAVPHCPTGKICMWSQAHFQGTRYDWSPDQGNVFLGAHGLADKVASFVASVGGCFQDSPPPEPATMRPVNAGDFGSDYTFGRRVDRIKPVC